MLEIVIVILTILLLFVVVQNFKLRKHLSKTNDYERIERALKEAESKIENLKNGYNNIKDENDFLKSKNRELQRKMKDLELANVELLERKEELQASKEKLEVLHKQKEELFAIAIHDIKNPVSAIKGYLDLLHSYDLTAQEQQEIMDGLLASSDKIVKLAQEIAQNIVSEKFEPNLNLKSASLKDIIDSVCRQNSAYAESKHVKLINKSSKDLPPVKVDPNKIEEAIDNLVNNAIKYGPEGTTVEVKTFFNSETITIEVNDDGQGIPKEEQEKIFSKGALLSTEPTGGESRNGLGLWIVKKIIEDHNGKVYVDSKEGVGSNFGIKLPYGNSN